MGTGRLRATQVAVAVALAAALAPAAALSAGADVRVSPAAGGTHRTFVVGFTAPGASGHDGLHQRDYRVAARGPDRRGCRSTRSLPATATAAGERVHVQLRTGAGERWCRGRFHGAVTMTDGPYCRPGQPCPLFPTRIVELGSFSFRVR